MHAFFIRALAPAAMVFALAGMATTAPEKSAPAKPESAKCPPAKPEKWGAPSELALSGPKPNPVPMPDRKELDAAIERGIRFLLGRQNKDGSWGSARQTKALNIYAPVPGAHQAFRSAVTGLCVMALIETGSKSGEVVQAVDRGQEWLLDNLPHLRRAEPEALYNNWGHAYGLQALAMLHRRARKDPELRERIEKVMAQQLDMLRRYECVDGGWCYYDFVAHTEKPSGSTISFVTAAVLVAMHDAKAEGAKIPEKLVPRATDSILRQRKPDYSYEYGEYLKWRPMHPVNRPAGSLGRSQACNLAMRYWGDTSVTEDVMITWLDRLFARNGWLSVGRKRPIPHDSWFKVAGYFYYFGHYYAARCIEELEPAHRPEPFAQLAHILLALQEKDGSWWDYPLYDYHQQYGTSFALMSLERCRRGLDRPASKAHSIGE